VGAARVGRQRGSAILFSVDIPYGEYFVADGLVTDPEDQGVPPPPRFIAINVYFQQFRGAVFLQIRLSKRFIGKFVFLKEL
jgi:hypothetical protein